MLDLLDNVLDLSKLENHKMCLEEQPTKVMHEDGIWTRGGFAQDSDAALGVRGLIDRNEWLLFDGSPSGRLLAALQAGEPEDECKPCADVCQLQAHLVRDRQSTMQGWWRRRWRRWWRPKAQHYFRTKLSGEFSGGGRGGQRKGISHEATEK